MIHKKVLKRRRIRHSIRKKIHGTADRPRMSVYKSNRNLYVQLIDDTKGCTLLSSSSKQVNKYNQNNCTVAEQIGKHLAEQAQKKKIKKVIFDRGGWPYHGKLKSLANSARQAGLSF